MKKILTIFIALTTITVLQAAQIRHTLTVTDTLMQTITGFGGACCDGAMKPLGNDNACISKLYGAKSKVGLNILRMEISPSFTGDNWGDYDWNGSLPSAKTVKKRGGIVFGTPWSPPSEYKTNGTAQGGNAEDQGYQKGKLREDCYDKFFLWLNTFLKWMKDHDVEMDAVSIQNEPDWWVSYSGCLYDPQDLVRLVKNYAYMLDRETYPGVRLISAEPLGFTQNYTDPLMNDETCREQIDIVAGHLYGHLPLKSGNLKDAAVLAAKYGKEVWMTEHSVTDNTEKLPTWYENLIFAEELNECMLAGCTAYIYWYLRAHWAFCGTGDTKYGEENKKDELLPRAYVMSHFSKNITGSTRLVTSQDEYAGRTEEEVAQSFQHSAYIKGDSIIVMAINATDNVRGLRITLPYKVKSGTLWLSTGNESENLCQKSELEITESVNEYVYDMPAYSLNTIIFKLDDNPATTYNLSIKATGNGSASYNDTSIRNGTTDFSVYSGTNASVTFSPDDGYRIKSVKVNNSNVTSSVSNNQYTISNISANTTLEVEFEAIPGTTYTLSIKATGNGSASYNGTSVKNGTTNFSVNSGSNATVTFSPDNGYRIKSVKVNDTDITSSVSNNQYTISNISANTTMEVVFEANPVMLTIKATGNGSATYDGTEVRNSTKEFSVSSGTKVTVSFSADSGYRIKTVKVNNTVAASNVSTYQHVISSISANTTLEVEFEVIPYKLTIKATGNGSATYNGTEVRGSTKVFEVDAGKNATVSFSPNNGYRIRSVKVGNSDVTSDVSDNQYTIKNITADVTLEVVFEFNDAPTTYTLTIEATGNGSVSYNGTTIKKASMNFSVNSGANATVSFNPDSGNRISSVRVNNTDVTSQVSGNQYTISNIAANTTMEVVFEEDVNAITVDGVSYKVVSQSDKTVNVTVGNYGQVLIVPASVNSNGSTWTVVGIETDALSGSSELAAVIWNPEATFNATVSNPNLLLYVKSEAYAPAAIQNVVVNGTASNIVLKEANSGNNFYCPQAFTAQHISYTHNYQMQTGIGESRGWETIALPFDVQTITHETKGNIVPFAQWKSGDATKPFWLYELAGTGFVEANSIKAYTPYIISMPNNPQYDSQWLLNGKVTFAASGVIVGKTEDLYQPSFNGRTFIPSFANMNSDTGVYTLNVNNDYETNSSSMMEGSMFMWKLRPVHPFEAFMTSSSSAPLYAFGVFDGMTTGIQTMVDGRWIKEVVIYDLQGRKVVSPTKKGVYIVNRKKMIIK